MTHREDFSRQNDAVSRNDCFWPKADLLLLTALPPLQTDGVMIRWSGWWDVGAASYAPTQKPQPQVVLPDEAAPPEPRSRVFDSYLIGSAVAKLPGIGPRAQS